MFALIVIQLRSSEKLLISDGWSCSFLRNRKHLQVSSKNLQMKLVLSDKADSIL